MQVVHSEIKILTMHIIQESCKDQRRFFEVDTSSQDLETIKKKLDWEVQVETLNLAHQ
jgi:Leucine-rich repeat (LRR) protein